MGTLRPYCVHSPQRAAMVQFSIHLRDTRLGGGGARVYCIPLHGTGKWLLDHNGACLIQICSPGKPKNGDLPMMAIVSRAV